MTQQPEGPMEGPYRVVRGNHKEDHAIAYWKIVPDAGLPRVVVKQLADDWCAALNAAYAAGLAARPAPPPTGERPWERLEARYVEAIGCWEAVGIDKYGSEVTVAALFGERDIRAVCDAYNAHRPARPAPIARIRANIARAVAEDTHVRAKWVDDQLREMEGATPDAEAIAREAAKRLVIAEMEDVATRIIADAIRKGRGE